jgi:tetratricopeptide (TPR) repeat protein
MRPLHRTLGKAFLGLVLTVANESQSMSDVSSKIAQAARFENWNAVTKLAPQLTWRDSSDLAPFVAVLDACVVVRCKHDPFAMHRSKWVTPELSEFAQAWIDIKSRNPARGRDRLRVLAAHSQYGWLGMYGLLHYAMDTENVHLIKATIEQSSQFEKRDSAISEPVADAVLLHAVLVRDYEQLPRLLETLGQRASNEARFERHLDYLIWKNDFIAARKHIETYARRFGNDHLAVRASIELIEHLLPVRQTVKEIDSSLKSHPNYWTLRLARISLAVNGDDKRAAAFLASERALPMDLAYLRLARFYRLAHGASKHVERSAKELEHYSAAYDDFPRFHVAAANIFKRQGKLQAAIDHLDIATRQSPLDLGVLSARGLLALEKNQVSEAVTIFSQVAKLDPRNAFAKLVLARAYIVAEEYGHANQVLQEVRLSKGYVPHAEIKALEQEIEEAVKRRNKK